MCFLNIKACQHILLHQIHQILIFKIASYKRFNCRLCFLHLLSYCHQCLGETIQILARSPLSHCWSGLGCCISLFSNMFLWSLCVCVFVYLYVCLCIAVQHYSWDDSNKVGSVMVEWWPQAPVGPQRSFCVVTGAESLLIYPGMDSLSELIYWPQRPPLQQTRSYIKHLTASISTQSHLILTLSLSFNLLLFFFFLFLPAHTCYPPIHAFHWN